MHTNSALSGTIIGGSNSTDKIISRNVQTTWNISSTGQGDFVYDDATSSTSNATTFFSGIENLEGSAAADDFIINNISVINVDGVSGTDSLTLPAVSVDISIGSSNVNGIGISNIDTIRANSLVQNTLRGLNLENTWVIDGMDSGSVETNGVKVNFENFQTLIGAENFNDSFMFGDVGVITTLVDGNGGSNSITGKNVESIWNITGLNEGKIDGATGSNYLAKYQNIDSLIGGNDTDRFVIGASGSFDGTINGGVSVDGVLDSLEVIGSGSHAWIIDAENKGSLDTLLLFSGIESLVGGDGNDVFTVTNNIADTTSGSLTGSITGGNGTDTLVGNNTSNLWVIDSVNGGSITSTINSFNGIENLTGGNLDDRFTITSSLTGLITGGGGNDTLDIIGLSSAVSVSLEANTTVDYETSDIENINANGGFANTLVGVDSANTWRVSGLDEGSVGTVNFNGFQNLTGGSASDDLF